MIKEVTDVEIKRAFDDLDLNGNGFLSPDEVLVAFRRFPDPPSREEIDAMISEFDESTDFLHYSKFILFLVVEIMIVPFCFQSNVAYFEIKSRLKNLRI